MPIYLILLILILFVFLIILQYKNNKEHFYIDDTDLHSYDKTSVPFDQYDINKLIHVMFPCSMKYGLASYSQPSQNGISNCTIIDCPKIDKYDFTDITCWKCCNYD